MRWLGIHKFKILDVLTTFKIGGSAVTKTATEINALTSNPKAAAEADLDITFTNPVTATEGAAVQTKINAILAKLRTADIITT